MVKDARIQEKNGRLEELGTGDKIVFSIDKTCFDSLFHTELVLLLHM